MWKNGTWHRRIGPDINIRKKNIRYMCSTSGDINNKYYVYSEGWTAEAYWQIRNEFQKEDLIYSGVFNRIFS